MTDIDFRRFASLFFALRYIGMVADPVKDAVEAADRLMEELKLKE
jgi:hypothetical protein